MKEAAKPVEKPRKAGRDEVLALRSEVRKCEDRLAKLAEMRARLQDKLADPALYDEAKKADLAIWTAKFAELEQAESKAEAMWLEAQEKLDAAEAR